jgi:hypothetical protein
MESNVVWSERFTLNLPPEISQDKSELDYLQRTNKEAWEAAPKPRLMPAIAQKLRPIIIVQPVFVAWAAEYFGSPITAKEIPGEETCERDVHTLEESRRDSGVEMEDDEEMEIETQSPNKSTGDCHCRRDSGISMGDEDERPYRNQDLAEICCCDGIQHNEDALFFESDIESVVPIDEAMIGLAV